MAKKLTPQQKRVQLDKNVAKAFKIEALLMDAESIKQQIDKVNANWAKAAKKFNETIKLLEVKQNRAKRLLRYKREQIVARNK